MQDGIYDIARKLCDTAEIFLMKLSCTFRYIWQVEIMSSVSSAPWLGYFGACLVASHWDSDANLIKGIITLHFQIFIVLSYELPHTTIIGFSAKHILQCFFGLLTWKHIFKMYCWYFAPVNVPNNFSQLP